MLDPGSQQILELILAKDPATIDELDREWLTARRSYLSEAQMKQFSIVDPTATKAAKAIEKPVEKEESEVTPVTVKNGDEEKAVEVESAPKPPKKTGKNKK